MTISIKYSEGDYDLKAYGQKRRNFIIVANSLWREANLEKWKIC